MQPTASSDRITYPDTRRDDSVVDVLHGERVADPYRWLEDTTTAETADWVARQNAVTESFLDQSPDRAAIRKRLNEIWDHPRVGAPAEHGGRWFQLRNTGLQAQPVLFVMTSPTGTGRVLLDPNTLSADGTIALMEWTVSRDGRLLAYATSSAGSDWMTWRVRDVETAIDVAGEQLDWSKFSGAAWSPDATALFYAAYDPPEPGREHLQESRIPRIMRHTLGTAQSEDALVYVAPDQPEWSAHVSATDDGRHLIVTVTHGTFPENQLHVLDLTAAASELRPLVDDFSSSAHVIGTFDDTFLLLTDDHAERRRVVAVDLAAIDRGTWREVVPEGDDTLLEAHVFGGRIVAHYLQDAHSYLVVLDHDGNRLHDIDVGGLVSVTELTGHEDSPLVHVAVASFTDPGSVWAHDLDTGTTTCVASSTVVDADRFVTTQQFAPSSDGVRVPIFLIHRDDVVPTGDVPVLLYGYGGFNIPLTPQFSALRAAWVERGGLAVVANLRGGGEYGRGWYDAGRLANKQNVFDDFCAAARWLGGPSGWSRPERIAIHGGSNGGLLVGACLTQHPELFGAAVPAVGVLDMLRFHKFTIGWAWTSDYGDPDVAEDYRVLRGYSPLHNIRPGTAYPPTLVLTGDHDDRVAPGHSFKFAAALQAAQSGDAPVLVRVETSAGHGAGKPTQKMIDEATDMLAFLDLVLAT